MSVAGFVVAPSAVYPTSEEDFTGFSQQYLFQAHDPSSSGLGDNVMIGHPEQLEQHYTLPETAESNGHFYADPGAMEFSPALEGSPSSSPTDSPSISTTGLPSLSGLDTYDHALAPGAASSQQHHEQPHHSASISNDPSTNFTSTNGINGSCTPVTSPTPPLPSYRSLPPMSPKTILNTLDEINASQPKKKSHARKQPAGHIPRPRNAFILFRCLFVCQQAVPASVEKDHRNISRIAGRVWKSMSEAEREPWVKAAEIEKTRHEEKWPGYRYNPVQPSTNPAQLRRNFTATVAGGSRNVTGGFGSPMDERGRSLVRQPALTSAVPSHMHFPIPEKPTYGIHVAGGFPIPMHAPQPVPSHLLLHTTIPRVGSAPPDNMNNDSDREMMPPPVLPTLPNVQFTHPFLPQHQSATPTPTSASGYSYDASPQLPPDSPLLFSNSPFLTVPSHNGMTGVPTGNDFFFRPPARRSSSCPPLPPGPGAAGASSASGVNGAGAFGGAFSSGLLDAWPAPSAYGLSSSHGQSHGHGTAMDVMADDPAAGMFRNPFSSGTTANTNANANAGEAPNTNAFTGFSSPFDGSLNGAGSVPAGVTGTNDEALDQPRPLTLGEQQSHPHTHSLLFQTPRYQYMHHGFDTSHTTSHHMHPHSSSSTRLVHRRGSSLDRAIASSSIAGAFGAFSGFAGQWSRASQQWSQTLWANNDGQQQQSQKGGNNGDVQNTSQTPQH